MVFLFLSGGLNIILLTFSAYSFIVEKSLPHVIEQKPASQQALEAPLAIDQGCCEVICHFKAFSFEQLVAKLGDSCLVENGFAKRDLALECRPLATILTCCAP